MFLNSRIFAVLLNNLCVLEINGSCQNECLDNDIMSETAGDIDLYCCSPSG